MARTTMATVREANVTELMKWHGGFATIATNIWATAVGELASEAAEFQGGVNGQVSSAMIREYTVTVSHMVEAGKLSLKLNPEGSYYYFEIPED